jgi:hypothetical protein
MEQVVVFLAVILPALFADSCAFAKRVRCNCLNLILIGIENVHKPYLEVPI